MTLPVPPGYLQIGDVIDNRGSLQAIDECLPSRDTGKYVLHTTDLMDGSTRYLRRHDLYHAIVLIPRTLILDNIQDGRMVVRGKDKDRKDTILLPMPTDDWGLEMLQDYWAFSRGIDDALHIHVYLAAGQCRLLRLGVGMTWEGVPRDLPGSSEEDGAGG